MSVEAYSAVLRAEIENAAEKAVLLGLANHAGPDGSHAYPSVARLSAYTSFAESTVREKLQSLREQGLIEVTKQASYHRPTEYWMNLPMLEEMVHPTITELDKNRDTPPIYGGQETSESQRSNEKEGSSLPDETSSSPKQTSSLPKTDLQLPDPNRTIKPSVKDSTVKEPVKLTRKEQTEIKNELALFFGEITELDVPLGESNTYATGRWWIPLSRILAKDEIRWNLDAAKHLILLAWADANEGRDFDVTSPRSLIGKCDKILAEYRRNGKFKLKNRPAADSLDQYLKALDYAEN